MEIKYFCFSCIGRFSTVGNVVAASQPKVTVKTRAAAEINKRVTCTKRVAAIGGVAGVVAGGSTTIQGNQTPKLPDYEDPVMQTVHPRMETAQMLIHLQTARMLQILPTVQKESHRMTH